MDRDTASRAVAAAAHVILSEWPAAKIGHMCAGGTPAYEARIADAWRKFLSQLEEDSEPLVGRDAGRVLRAMGAEPGFARGFEYGGDDLERGVERCLALGWLLIVASSDPVDTYTITARGRAAFRRWEARS